MSFHHMHRQQKGPQAAADSARQTNLIYCLIRQYFNTQCQIPYTTSCQALAEVHESLPDSYQKNYHQILLLDRHVLVALEMHLGGD